MAIGLLGLRRDKILQDTKVPKTLFYELDDFNAPKKKIFTNEVAEILLLAILNEDTINIAPFKSEEVNYSEIYVVYVELKKEKNIALIVEAIQKNIHNPVIVILGFENKLRFFTATKRLNKAEKGKQVTEDTQTTGWLSPQGDLPQEKKYLEGLNITNFSFHNLFAFYQEFSNYIYQLALIPFVSDFLFLKKLAIQDIKPAIEAFRVKEAEVRRLTEEEVKIINFGDRIAIHRKLLDAQKEKEEAGVTIGKLLEQA